MKFNALRARGLHTRLPNLSPQKRKAAIPISKQAAPMLSVAPSIQTIDALSNTPFLARVLGQGFLSLSVAKVLPGYL
jgi:hypothetical protein